MTVEDVYLLAVHAPYESTEHPVEINATIVHAKTLLHAHVLQPDGGMMYRCLTEFPGRTPGCLVPLSTLTFELNGGQLWPDIADWAEVEEGVVRLARRGECDAVALGLSSTASVLLANGPLTVVTTYSPAGQLVHGLAERQEQLERLQTHVRDLGARGPFWPGDRLVASPTFPRTMPYRPMVRVPRRRRLLRRVRRRDRLDQDG